MSFIGKIFSTVWDLSDYFYNAYQEVRGWIWPFSYLQYPLYGLYQATRALLNPIADFWDWSNDISFRISGILDKYSIMSLLDPWLHYAETAWSWIKNAWRNVVSIIDAWWSSVSYTVLGWIDQAKEWARTLISQVEIALGDQRSSWEDFWTTTWPGLVQDVGGIRAAWDEFLVGILPSLATWTGVQVLIDSTLGTWFPFYDELVEFWGEIRDLFTDPENYLVRKLETMLERFW